MPSSDSPSIAAFGRTRLQQVTRLAAVQRQFGEDLNTLGRASIHRAMMAMVRDCHAFGVSERRIAKALQVPERTAHASDAPEQLSPPRHVPNCFVS